MHSLSTRFDILSGRIETLSRVDLGNGDNPYGMLLSRNCPATLRFNFEADRCDYAPNVKCAYV